LEAERDQKETLAEGVERADGGRIEEGNLAPAGTVGEEGAVAVRVTCGGSEERQRDGENAMDEGLVDQGIGETD